MLRIVGGTFAGIIVAIATVFVVERIGHLAYPVRELDLGDGEAVAALIARMPLGALLLVAAAWLAGAFAGGFVAALAAGRAWAAWPVGAVVAAAAIANVFMYPHPEWMQVSAVIAPGVGVLLAGHLARARLAARAHRPAAA